MVLPQGNIISFDNLGGGLKISETEHFHHVSFPIRKCVFLGCFSIGQLLFMINVLPCRNHLEIHLRVSFHLASSSKRVVYWGEKEKQPWVSQINEWLVFSSKWSPEKKHLSKVSCFSLHLEGRGFLWGFIFITLKKIKNQCDSIWTETVILIWKLQMFHLKYLKQKIPLVQTQSPFPSALFFPNSPFLPSSFRHRRLCLPPAPCREDSLPAVFHSQPMSISPSHTLYICCRSITGSWPACVT